MPIPARLPARRQHVETMLFGGELAGQPHQAEPRPPPFR